MAICLVWFFKLKLEWLFLSNLSVNSYLCVYTSLYLPPCPASLWLVLCLVTWDPQCHLHIPLPLSIVSASQYSPSQQLRGTSHCPEQCRAAALSAPQTLLRESFCCCIAAGTVCGKAYSFTRAKVERCQKVIRNVQNTMLCGRSQAQKITYCMIPFVKYEQ